MRLGLFLLFVVLPIVEIALFVVVGGAIGVLPTIGLVILAALAGITVLRRQSERVLMMRPEEINAMGDKVGSLAQGAMRVMGAILLIIPGFLTDAVGILLLLPPVQKALIRSGAGGATVRATVYARTHRPGAARPGPFPQRPPATIDADYDVIEEGDPDHPKGNSGWTRQP